MNTPAALVPENLLAEVRHHLNDEKVTTEDIIAAHNRLAIGKVGLTAMMPLPFMKALYIDADTGEVKSEQIIALSESIQTVRNRAVKGLDEALRLKSLV